MSTDGMQSQLATYLNLLVSNLREEFNENLCAVYLFGSSAYGAYEQGISDVDVYAIIHTPILDYYKLSRTISHAVLPCPARKLEFVLFTKSHAAKQTANPKFELNFNTGKDMNDYINLNAGKEPRFWFLLDIAIGREVGKSLFGPPSNTLFAAPKAEWILDCMIELLAWQRKEEILTSDGILNACRVLRYLKSSLWSSKMEAGVWVLEHYDQPKIVNLAMQARASKNAHLLSQDLALDFLLRAENEVEESKKKLIASGTG